MELRNDLKEGLLTNKLKDIYLAGGCFWGVEAFLKLVDGVVYTEVGYINGNTQNPTYKDVCSNSGHAEVVYVIYNPSIISLENLIKEFFKIIDPTIMNRQGPDIGVQYRTGIYYTNESDAKIIENSIDKLSVNYDKPIVVEVKGLENYYSAELEHQNYLDKNPNGYCHIDLSKYKKNN